MVIGSWLDCSSSTAAADDYGGTALGTVAVASPIRCLGIWLVYDVYSISRPCQVWAALVVCTDGQDEVSFDQQHVVLSLRGVLGRVQLFSDEQGANALSFRTLLPDCCKH